MKPDISVLLVTRNREQFLDLAIKSILDQDYQNFEFIIVDDKSTDKTPEILRHWAQLDTRIKLFHQQTSRGLPAGLNLAASHAQGQFYARMDDDDISLPNRFSRQLQFLRDNPRIIAVGTAIQVIDEDGEHLNIYHPPQSHQKIDAELLRAHGGAMVHPSIIIRRDDFHKINGYNESYLKVQDLDLYLRLSEIGELANLSEVLVLCRTDSRRADRSSKEDYEKVFSYHRQIVTSAYQRRAIEGTPEIDLPKINHRAQLLWNLAVGGYVVGNYKAAKKHVFRSLVLRPLSARGWWMLIKSTLRSLRHRSPVKCF